MKRSDRSAFTLVEVLIVVVIIAVLATIGTLTYQNVQRDANDEARDNGAKVISEALERYYQKHGEYPSVRSLVNTYADNSGAAVAARLGLKPEDLLLEGLPAGVTNPFTEDTSPDYGFITYLATGDSSCQSDLNGGCDKYILKYAQQAVNELAVVDSRYNGRGSLPHLGEITMRVGTGYQHSVATNMQGQVFGWGLNDDGELGDGSVTQRLTPIATDMSGVLAGKAVKDLVAGDEHALALASDGKLYSWGYNDFGQLGDNTLTTSHVPVAVVMSGVLAGKTINSLAAGSNHSMVLASDGWVYSWGRNNFGQLGNNTTTNAKVPVAISQGAIPAGVKLVKIASAHDHTLVIGDNGRVYAWGHNQKGQLGINTTANSLVPVAVDVSGVLAGKTVSQVSVHSFQSIALTDDGKVYAWGDNGYGQLGDGTYTTRLVPVATNMSGALSGKTVKMIFTGHDQTYALDSDNKLYAWGFNGNGQLGDGTTADKIVPTAINMAPFNGRTIVTLSSHYHTLAIMSDASIFAWGYNIYGMIGNGTTVDQLTPTRIYLP